MNTLIDHDKYVEMTSSDVKIRFKTNQLRFNCNCHIDALQLKARNSSIPSVYLLILRSYQIIIYHCFFNIKCQ